MTFATVEARNSIVGAPKYMTLEMIQEYILARSTRRGSCLIMTGFGTQRGIYQKAPGRAWSHVASFIAFGGDYAPGLDVAHLCSAKDCVEPRHLRQMTRSENLLYDSARRALRIMCPHPRQRDARGKLAVCPVCNRANQRRWRERNSRTSPGKVSAAASGEPQR